MLCDECESRPCNTNHQLCQLCYERRQSRSRNRCGICSAFLDDGDVCEDCEDNEEESEHSEEAERVPPEDASYEELIAWEESRMSKLDDPSLPDRFPVWKSERVDSTNNCCICCDTYKHGEEIRSLPCLHYFHSNCIDPWLISKHTCPICMTDVKVV